MPPDDDPLDEAQARAEASPCITISDYGVRFRFKDIEQFTYMTTARSIEIYAIEDMEERGKALAAQDARTCISLGEHGLELWIVDPAKATAVKATGDPSV